MQLSLTLRDCSTDMRTLDLFCGCGGMSLGFQKAGFEIKAAIDHWKPALASYQRNFSHPVFERDLSVIDLVADLAGFRAEMVIGGPPCQDFSSAGKRDQALGRADLTLQFANIVTQLLPRWFVMENVELASKSPAYASARALFLAHGYGLTAAVLDASLASVPQNRKRLFLIGQLGGQPQALFEGLQLGLAAAPMTLRQYFGDRLGLDFYYRHPRSYARRAIFSIDEPSPTIRGVNRPIPATYQLHEGDPVPSLAGIRPLTTLERAQIQTFPPSFEFIGSKTDIEQQIGNAVPVNLATHVAQAILAFAARPRLAVQQSLFAAL
jgi:DNA (cytosine-5)-methyltransferase 1